MAFIYRYELKDLGNRKKTDLTQNSHSENITFAIDNIFDKRLKEIKVSPKQFEFRLNDRASLYELTSMGRNIAANDNMLNNIKKIYGRSSQLFHRVRESNFYAFLVEYEKIEDTIRLSFDLVDQKDADYSILASTTEDSDNQDTARRIHDKVSILADLDMFHVTIIMKKDQSNFIFRNDLELEERKWYLVTGGLAIQKPGNSEIFLDYTSRHKFENKYAVDISSSFQLTYLQQLNKQDEARLENFFSLNGLEYKTDPQIKVKYNADEKYQIIVYSVGQGLCSAICDGLKKPLIYFDFGGGDGFNTKTYPVGKTFEFSNDTQIILSHWHSDHWASVAYCPEALNFEWIIPDQKKGGIEIKLFADLSSKGKLYVADKKLNTRWGIIMKADGSDKHYHNNGFSYYIKLAKKNSNGKKSITSYLLSGDNRYQHLPLLRDKVINVLVASHHGGTYFEKSRGRQDSIPNCGENGIIVYSYGKHADFGVRNNSHGHPQKRYINEYRLKGWTTEKHTPDGDVILE